MSDRTMMAVRAYGAQDFRMESVAVPSPGPLEVLIKVATCGICASDTKMFKGSPFYWGPNGRVTSRPVIPGHEFVGWVEELGEGAAEEYGLAVGDLAVCEQLIPCYSCWYCENKNYNKCDSLIIYGQGVDGAMADYMIYRKGSMIYKVPDGLPPKSAVFAEPLAVSVHAADRASLRPNETVIVGGCGPIGLGVVAAVKTQQPSTTVIALDYYPYKLDLAKQTGADHTINMNDTDAVQQALALTHGRGCDVYFENSGNPEGIQQGLDMVRKQGRIVHVSICTNGIIKADWNAISAGKELVVLGSSLGVGCWDRAMDMLLQGRLPMEGIVTHQLPMSEFQKGYDLVMDKEKCIKVLMIPDADMTPTGLQRLVAVPTSSKSPSPVPEEKAELHARAPSSHSVHEHIQSILTNNPNAVSQHFIDKRLDGIAPGAVHSPSAVHVFHRSSANVVLVTGSSRGIGRVVAEHLSMLGARVVFHGTREHSPSTFDGSLSMQELAKQTQQKTGNAAMSVVGDLTKPAVCASITATINKEWGQIDYLVCCAGGNIGATGVNTKTGGKPLQDDALQVSDEDVQHVLNVNLATVINTCRAIVPAMKARKSGRVVIVGSVAGTVGRPDGVLYAVAKAAVHEYTRCLAVQLRPFNIAVNCVAPGATMTERFVRNLGTNLNKELASATSDEDSLIRYGTPQDTANVVAMMCSPLSSFMTGQVVRVDGGVQTFPC